MKVYDPERARGAETRRAKERTRKRRQAFLSQSSPCQSCKKAAKPIILSSSFFSGAAEASLDCHMYKGSPYKAIHSTEWTRHLWGFLISSSLFFLSFFKPCNQIWAKSNGGRIEREQWGGWEGSMKVPFVGLKRASNLQNALPLCRGLREERNQ